MKGLITSQYNGQELSFSEQGWFNATQAASRFNKKPNDWLRLPDTQRYVDALIKREDQKSDTRLSRITDFVKTQKGNSKLFTQGTWLHPKLAVRFAQWLDYETNSEYLFPSRSDKSKPKSDTVFIMALRRMGFEGRETPHGFRHIASILLNNRGFDERHIESALAHVKDGVAGVYNKAQYLQDRANMMQLYANHLEEIADQTVIQFKRVK
jgi:hypothetical protein